MFTGFPRETIAYFLNLRFNNYISFYNETKEAFIRDVKTPFHQFINAMAPTMLSIDPLIEVRPDKCLARIRRDTRFTKDKSPFRDHLWLLFRRRGESRETCVMYWFELSPESMEWGVGFWGENRVAMNTLRRRMNAEPEHIEQLIASCHLSQNNLYLAGEDGKRIICPGSLPESLRPWYIKKQLYIVKKEMTVQDAYSPELSRYVQNDFCILAPIYQWLRECADEPLQRDEPVQEYV
jgi:uncharacterized protein (TIGR02453 family)